MSGPFVEQARLLELPCTETTPHEAHTWTLHVGGSDWVYCPGVSDD